MTSNKNNSVVDKIKYFVNLILILNLSCPSSEAANILFFIGGISSHSHRVAVQPLANKLAEIGHKVTFFSPLKSSTTHPSIVEFCPEELKEFNKPFLVEFGVAGLRARLQEKGANEILKGTVLSDTSFLMCQTVLNSDLKSFLKQKFDLVVIDNVANECAFGLAYHFKAKTVLFNPISSLMPWDADKWGFASDSSWIPTMENVYDGEEMSLLTRLYNEWSLVTFWWQYRSYHLPRMDKLIRDTLDVGDMPPLEEVMKRVDLMLLNQHYSDHYARGYPPFIIPVGGMHFSKSNSNGTLPVDMEKFIREDGDVTGFIYISFGSAIKISTIPRELLQVFFDAVANLKNLRFLWKWEGDIPQDAPKNIFFYPWFPQEDVLAHPKIRGFVMQGGQISLQQAICNGVPLLMFPVNGDQDVNAKRLRVAGNGLDLEFFGLTAPVLEEALKKLVQDPSFGKKAKQLANACNDRPMTALDTAVWWVQYVLRTENTDHLKPLRIHQSWIVTRSLDVFAVVFILILLALVALILVVRTVLSFFGNSSLTSKPKTKRS